ncbi:hypothetical protein AB0D14_21650 [Streptomyces sp. NPDC048484]|uniref:hypothetical protein n=1 Tax=Streptomyces sp. NPDC048484 TaxID=3155146 RepID=UPI00341D66B1
MSACDPGDKSDGEGRKGLDLSVVTEGWGPGRETFTENGRPDSAVLNSVTDNPKHGDERNFLALKDVSTGQWYSKGDVSLEPGRTYEASIFFRNDADPGTGRGASTGTRVRAQLPAEVKGRKRITGFVQSDNTAPSPLWRSLALVAPADQPVSLRILPDSSRVYTGALPKGAPLPAEELFSGAGTLIGCASQDGVVTGAEQCTGHVQFRFVADQPNFVISQAVSRAATNAQESGLRFTEGTRVEYKLRYRNTGTTQQNYVVLKESLPAGFHYVPDSTHYSMSATGGEWKKTADGVMGDGINLGSFAPGGGAYLKFTAILPRAEDLECGLTSTTSTVSARTQNGTKSAESVVLVEKKCG